MGPPLAERDELGAPIHDRLEVRRREPVKVQIDAVAIEILDPDVLVVVAKAEVEQHRLAEELRGHRIADELDRRAAAQGPSIRWLTN